MGSADMPWREAAVDSASWSVRRVICEKRNREALDTHGSKHSQTSDEGLNNKTHQAFRAQVPSFRTVLFSALNEAF